AAVTFAYVAVRERTRAQGNLRLARNAVDQSLSSADRARDPASVDPDPPALEQLRLDLLQRAGSFYAEFLKQAPNSEESRRDAALGHFRLGQIHRMTQRAEESAAEYRA